MKHIDTVFERILQRLDDDKNLREIADFRHSGAYIITDKNEKLLNFASNDYLGISSQRAIFKAFLQNLKNQSRYFSSSSSRLLSGGFPIFAELESFLSNLYGKSALLFNSGYHCNISCIQALGTLEKSIFLIDRLIHASVIDGLRGAKFRRFPHNDMNALRALIEEYRHFQHIIIVSEGIFSMDGDLAQIEKLLELKNTYPQVLLYFDEAHSIGICGENGLGLGYEYREAIDFIAIPFGKALSSMGACMLCSASARAFFSNFARGLIYSTALPPINIAWSAFIWQNLQKYAKKRKHIFKLSQMLKENATAKGYEVRGEKQILSIICGENAKAIALSQILREKGIFAPAIKEPTVPKGSARIRISLCANMTKAQIETLISAL